MWHSAQAVGGPWTVRRTIPCHPLPPEERDVLISAHIRCYRPRMWFWLVLACEGQWQANRPNRPP